MLTALLLAGVCALPPLFDMSGPDCSAQNQRVECGCSECMQWEAPLEGPVPDYYEIWRQDPGSTQLLFIGSTLSRNKPLWYYDDEPIPATIATMWCFAWDYSLPKEGELYLYRLKGCIAGIEHADAVCGEFSSRSIDYVAAPYWVYP